jgi:hypothetical protein
LTGFTSKLRGTTLKFMNQAEKDRTNIKNDEPSLKIDGLTIKLLGQFENN